MDRPSLVWVCLVSSLMLGQENHSGRELQKAASVGKTDAGKEERAETVSDSSSKAVDKPACLTIAPDLSRYPKTEK